MDPMTHRFSAEDPAKPADVRFLHVLQGANANGAKIVPTTVLSSAGVTFEGAVIGTRAVMFKRDLYANFTSTTFTVPATVTERIVTGLAVNGAYTITTQNVAGDVQITITAGGNVTANAAGMLKF
jgi:hypothetical protein